MVTIDIGHAKYLDSEAIAAVEGEPTLALTGVVSGLVATLPQINDTSEDHQYIFGVSELTVDRTVTLPLLGANATFSFVDFAEIFSAVKTFSAEPVWNDSIAVALGAGSDSRIYYDGTDTFWDLQAVGTGGLMMALAGSFPSPDVNAFHIFKGSAGTITPHAASVLILENLASANVYFSFMVADDKNAGFVINNPTATNHANIQYNGANERWIHRIDGSNRLFYSAGAFAFQEATIVSSSAGDITWNPTGNVVIGADVFIAHDVNAGLTASTTQTQVGGLALTTEINEVSTVANTDDTVTLPTAVTGIRCLVINNGANQLQIFPASGDDLGAGVDTATTVSAGSKIEFLAWDATNWQDIT